MQEKKRIFINTHKLLPGISRLLVIFGISLFVIQFLGIPALAESVEYYDGYNVITYDNGSKYIISGALNFFRWDEVWRPEDELNISNGSWPYLFSENATTADFRVEDATLSLPKTNTRFKLNKNSISYDIVYSKSEFEGKETPINLTDAFIDLQYDLKSGKPKNKYKDKNNIKFGRFHFKAGIGDIAIHDDTLRNYTEDGKVYQDVTYLKDKDYDFGIDNNGDIRLKFKKEALNNLTGNVTIEIRTWDIIGPGNWGGNVVFSQTKDVKATGNVELRQKFDDYVLYTRFDEGSGTTIHNEKSDYLPLGTLYGDITTGTWVTNGKYGKAIYFNGIDSTHGNRILFNDHSSIRLPGNFVISAFLYHTGYDNPDTDIMRKGSSATADAWNKLEVGANLVPNTIYAFVVDPSLKVELKDTTEDRRDGNWHFIALTREGTTCKLMVDGNVVSSKTCSDDTVNTAQLSIGAKDGITPDDYIEGLLDEVRMYDRILTPTELTAIQNNEHYTAGSITRDLSSFIIDNLEIKELGCHGTWDRSTTQVYVMASTDNVNWVTIQSNAYSINYNVPTPNNYKYFRCELRTSDTSKTPVIQSMEARIDPKAASYINGTVKDSSSNLGIAGVTVSTNTGVSKTTNAAGFYSFAVTPGITYTITATLDPIYIPQSASVTAVQGMVVKDFSLVKKATGTITGSVNNA